MMALTSPEKPQLVPDLAIEESREQHLTASSVVSYQQTSKSIPVFGSRAVVELDAEEKTLIGIKASLAELPDISSDASVSGWIKEYKRIATRFEKNVSHYLAMVHIAIARMVINWNQSTEPGRASQAV